MILKISEFTISPGARYKSDGPYSGEEYFEEKLLPAFKECQQNKEILTIDMDGTWGYASSFLSSAFGRLAKKFPSAFNQLQFISTEDPNLVAEIKGYMDEK